MERFVCVFSNVADLFYALLCSSPQLLRTGPPLVGGGKEGKLVGEDGDALLLDAIGLRLGAAHGGEDVGERGDDL